MKFEFPQISRCSIILIFVSLLNAGKPRYMKGQAGIDRLWTTEYRPSPDVTADHYEGWRFFYCHLVILLPLGNSTATFHISTAMAVEIDFHFFVWQ